MAAVYENVCESPLLMRSTLDRSKKQTNKKKNQNPSHRRKKKYDCSFILIWKPSVLAHHQHQTSALLCFSLWKVQPWTEATGNNCRLPLIQKTGGADIMAGLELTRLNEPLFLNRDLEGAMERASR